jgi:hypothetical protein
VTACDQAETIAAALFAKQRAWPETQSIPDSVLTGIVQTVVADTCLILDGPLTAEDFTP